MQSRNLAQESSSGTVTTWSVHYESVVTTLGLRMFTVHSRVSIVTTWIAHYESVVTTLVLRMFTAHSIVSIVTTWNVHCSLCYQQTSSTVHSVHLSLNIS